jgi:uroporphyrinogen decarboxylase
MTEMTSRERVYATFAHKQPDRMPVDLMGTASCMKDEVYFGLLKTLGLKGEGRAFREGNVRYYDPCLLDALGVDFRRVWMRPVPWKLSPDQDGTMIDEWGVRLRLVGRDWTAVQAPLANATISDLEKYPWPSPYEQGRLEGLAEEARHLRETTTCAISARSPLYGMFETAQRLRGMEHFLTDLLLDKPFAVALIRKLTEVHIAFWDAYLDVVGPYVDMVEMSDDYGSQTGPLISPKTFKEILAPSRKELNDFIKRKAPHVKIFLHTDGSIIKLIPQLIEIGVEVLNPIEPDAAGNDALTLKKTFGSELVFHGHLDVKGAMRGSLEDVRAEIRRIVDIMAEGGGFIMAPTNHLQPDVPVENIIEAYRYAHEYSRGKA